MALGAQANAAGPGHPGIIDRPTPPPCCADGVCYPNPVTWGAYPTRWRRWPTVALGAAPADTAAPGAPDDALPPFEVPRKEEEDRRAPPPTQPVEERPTEGEGEPATPGGPTSEFPPATQPGGVTPPTTLIPPPSTNLSPPGDRALDLPDSFPFDDDPAETPAEPETDGGLPFGDDMSGDSDPPPRLPFSTSAVAKGPALRPAVKPVSAPANVPVIRPLPSSNDDPPPALPGPLASAAF